jgi:hypothetical protein
MGSGGGGRERAAVLLLGLVLASVPRTAAANAADEAQEIMADADLVHTATFSYASTAATWERILDEPLLMGALWQAYGFAPAYRVSGTNEVIHVQDPTGLVGDAVPCGTTPGRRQWLARGRLDHWAVPFFNDGEAVFVLETRSAGPRIEGTLTVHVRAASVVGRLVLRAGRSLLARHVASRVRLNLADAGRIVEAVDADPGAVAARLTSPWSARFLEVFVPDRATGGR